MLGKKEDGAFLRGVDTPMHAMNGFTLPGRTDAYCTCFFNLLFRGAALLTLMLITVYVTYLT